MLFGLARLGLAGFLLWALVANLPLRAARARLLALPEADHAATVRALREQGRYGEAIVVADSIALTMSVVHGTALDREREAARRQSESWAGKLKDAGWAAATGEGTSSSALAGAMASDALVVGDVRDLVIEGARHAWPGGDDADPVIVELSTIGLATTLAPPIDAVPSLLKWARRNGALTDELGAEVVAMARDKQLFAAGGLLWDVAGITRRASPGGAMTILRGVRSSEGVARLAACVQRGPHGAPALILTDGVGSAVLTDAASRGLAAAREDVVIDASWRGSAGRDFLQSAAARPLLRGHPLTRVVARVPAGAPAIATARVLRGTEAGLAWWIAGVCAWLALEAALMTALLRTKKARPTGRA